MNFYVGRAGPKEGVITFCHILDTKNCKFLEKGLAGGLLVFASYISSHFIIK